MTGPGQPDVGHLARLAGVGGLTTATPRLPERFAPPDRLESAAEQTIGPPGPTARAERPSSIVDSATPPLAGDPPPPGATVARSGPPAGRRGHAGPTDREVLARTAAADPAITPADPVEPTAPRRRLERARPAAGPVPPVEAAHPEPRVPRAMPPRATSMPALRPLLPEPQLPPAPDRSAPRTAPPVLRVSIGRIDVRGPDVRPAPEAAPPRARAGLTLGDYLQGRRDE